MPDAARIALDAFGGDLRPDPEIDGAIAAARRDVHVILVGDEAKLAAALDERGGVDGLPITIRHAPDVITMSDEPGKAIRNKPEASMPVCFDLVKAGEADAAMSAGNSGAMLACGLFKYRRIKGVDRPALVTSLPTRARDWTTVLDVGANVECRPINLVQFAVMGSVYARFKHGKDRPRVGLLSNGTESSKGTELTRVVDGLMKAHDFDGGLDYVGYVEGDALYSGDVDVIVTDGFSGNVGLKIAEATGRLIGGWLKDAIADGSLASKLGALLMRSAFSELRAMLDPDTYGAAPLLGVQGVAFICHGGSSSAAIGRALELAARSVHDDLAGGLKAALDQAAPLFDAAKAAA